MLNVVPRIYKCPINGAVNIIIINKFKVERITKIKEFLPLNLQIRSKCFVILAFVSLGSKNKGIMDHKPNILSQRI